MYDYLAEIPAYCLNVGDTLDLEFSTFGNFIVLSRFISSVSIHLQVQEQHKPNSKIYDIFIDHTHTVASVYKELIENIQERMNRLDV